MSPPSSPQRGEGQASALPKNEGSEIPGLVDVIAERVAARVLERLQRDGQGATRPALLDVAGVARLLDVSHDYVRAHRDELGVVRLPGAPLRFDAVVVAELMVSCCCTSPWAVRCREMVLLFLPDREADARRVRVRSLGATRARAM
jgi:hypothetical protein